MLLFSSSINVDRPRSCAKPCLSVIAIKAAALEGQDEQIGSTLFSDSLTYA